MIHLLLRFTLVISLGCFTSQVVLGAEVPPPIPPAPTATPAATTPEQPEKVDPADLPGLEKHLNAVATVEGTIARAGQSKSETVRYLNFNQDYRKSLSLVFFTSDGDFPKEKVEAYVGKKISATGTITQHDGRYQMKISSFDEIKVIEAPAALPTPAAPSE